MKKVEYLFPIAVIVLSLINVLNHFDFSNIPSLLLSFIGIFGAISYFFSSNWYKPLIYLWITAQLIVIPSFWDTTQVFSLKFGLHLELKNGVETGLLLNFVPFFYFAPFLFINLSNLVGEEITINGFREDNRLGDVFPLKGKIRRVANLSGQKDWLLVSLFEEFEYDGTSIKSVFLKPKDTTCLEKSDKNQLAFMRLVVNESEVKEHISDIMQFPFIDWVLVKTK